MKTQPKMTDLVTPEIKSLVNAYLMARTYAEVMRGKVDAIYLDILTECPIYADKHDSNFQIFNSGDFYLCSSEALVQDAYDEANKRERAAKIKPDSMPDDHCPALVAEHLQTQCEWALIAASGKPFGVTNDGLLCTKNGLANRQKWIDLIVKLIVSQPGFRNPLTNEKGQQVQSGRASHEVGRRP